MRSLQLAVALAFSCLAACGTPPATGVPTGHRVDTSACPRTAALAGACTTDADCTSGLSTHCLGGRCSQDACLLDTDCTTAGTACSCNDRTSYNIANSCVPAPCKIDSDCGTGQYCLASPSPFCTSRVGATGYYCTTLIDVCRNDSDCAMGELCVYDTTMVRWDCSAMTCP